MGNQQPNNIYNIVSIVFVVLSVCICLTTLGWVSGSVPVPGPLSVPTDVPLPTHGVQSTFTPTFTHTPPPPPTWTPFGTPAATSDPG